MTHTTEAALSEPMRYVLVAKVKSYLGLHDEAIRWLSDGLVRHSDSPHLLRHRGEFLLTVLRLDEALADLRRSTEVLIDRPDEIDFYRAQLLPEVDRAIMGWPADLLAEPTPVNEVTLERWRDAYKGTLKSSAWYHYALASYLRGSFVEAADRFGRTLEYTAGDDSAAAAANWRYLSLRRAGEHAAAAEFLAGVPAELHVNEPSYWRLLRTYRGEIDPDATFGDASDDRRGLVTRGYGVGAWHLVEGDEDRAVATFRRVLAIGDVTAFGHLAALQDLARMERPARGA